MSRTSRNKGASVKPTLINSRLLRSWPLPSIDEGGDKELRGRVLIIAGSDGMPGAAILAATCALRAGAGKLQIATPARIAPWVAIAMPEALVIGLPQTKKGISPAGAVKALKTHIESANAVLVGPGMTDGPAIVRFVRMLLPLLKEKTLILDAEALQCVVPLKTKFKNAGVEVVITPHAGEMAKILHIEKEEVLEDAKLHARNFAKDSGIVTVLKGRETFLADPNGKLYNNLAGNAGLGVSGSGDTLAGIIAGLAARGATAAQAAAWGVHLHASAGDLLAKRLGPLGYLPREIPMEIPALLKKFSK